MQQKVLLLNVNNIGQNMGEEIYSHTIHCLTDCDTTKPVPDLKKKCEYVMLETLSGKFNVILRVTYIT